MHQLPGDPEHLALTPEEQNLVRDALRRIQRSQGLINEAAQSLCSVRGFADEWSDSAQVYETVKAYWHQVEVRRRELS